MTVISIDFGTSNTIVAYLDPVSQVPRSLALEGISRPFSSSVYGIPTLLFIQDQKQIFVGEEVRSRRLGLVQPERFFHSFKRDLVAEYVPPERSLDGILYSTEQIAYLFLERLKQALLKTSFPVSQVIFTVPVGSFERYLTWIRQVTAQLELPNILIVDESTAAALGYALTHPGSVVLVIDFGGGTLDLSLIRTPIPSPGETVFKAEVIAKTDAYIGGIDIDAWIVDYYLAQLGSSRTTMSKMSLLRLSELAEKVKIQLSTQEEACESWFDDDAFMAYELRLTRSELEEILESNNLIDQIRFCLDEILLTAQRKGIPKSSVDYVLLVGGGCQIPTIQNLVGSYFGRKKVKADNPFAAVAEGALALSRQVQLEDYLHHTYAIRLWDPYSKVYTYYPLFEKGAKYPCVRPEPLILQVANENDEDICLDIGEVADTLQAEMTYDPQGRMTSRYLTRHSEFRLLSNQRNTARLARLNPPGKVGVDRLQVSFSVNSQRTLLATVLDLQTQTILVDQKAIAKLE
jgi:molecular chaperone DnaK (HSP70)